MVVFAEIYKEYGTQIRFTAILNACEMQKMSTIIRTSQKELQNFAMTSIVENTNYKDQKFLFATMSSVLNSVREYRLGYQEATTSLITIEKDYCKKMAPTILEEFKHKFKTIY